MVQADLTPDTGTLTGLIGSLADRGQWQDADRVFEIAVKTAAYPPSSLDGEFEVDVSRLPSAIAKVKVCVMVLVISLSFCVRLSHS